MNLALSRALWESSFYNPDFLYEKAEAQRGQAMRQKSHSAGKSQN